MGFEQALRINVLLVILWIYFDISDGTPDDNGSDCNWIKCYNSGTVVKQDQHCVCQCLSGFSGILCEYGMMPSSWPDGPYALLMPSTGCPEDEMYGWSPGHINITTQHPMEIWTTHNKSMTSVPLSETPSKLAGPFGSYTIQFTFCFKHAGWPSQPENIWPTPEVSVFGVRDGCPKGMVEEERAISLPPFRSWWSDGYLPNFEIRAYDNGTEFFTTRCLLNITDNNEHMFISKPFIIMKERGISCSATEDKAVEEETLTLFDGREFSQTYTNITFCIYVPNGHIEESYPMTFCLKKLGLTDGTIEDYQITASTWDNANTPPMARVSDAGWCPAVDDPSPYLQIDLLAVSLIEGISLYNMVNYINRVENNIYTQIPILEGCRSFMISYGMFTDAFTNYTERSFVVDSSQNFDQPQLFMFMPPFLARYVRIHPLEPVPDGRLCLRIELLGCPSTKSYPMPLCRKKLGLTDGTIEDYQITASTWINANTPPMARVSDAGWCPAVDDPSPYLQIDLLAFSLIEGITLYPMVNYIDRVENNVYTQIQVPEGCRLFMISYGIFTDAFKNYSERSFVVDSSRKFDQPQRFLFMRPFLARYVRIHPLEPVPDGRLCLRIELLGCPSTTTLTPICNKGSPAYWIPLSSVTNSSLLSTISTFSGNISSLNDCQQACEQRIGACKAIQYIGNKECSLYASAFPDMSPNTYFQPQGSFAIRVCFREPSLPKYICLDSNNSKELDVTVLNNTDLNSMGYPLHYSSNSLFKWKVTSTRGGFIRLNFAVIDFYSQSIIQNADCLDDTLTFDKAFQPITSSQNGLTPTFPTDKETLDIIFITCERRFRRSERRQGFRIIVKNEESPTIWDTNTGYGQEKNGHLMSYSLLGLNIKLPEKQRWGYHSAYSGGPYVLTFWHFNIPCVDGSYLNIWDGAIYNEQLCNSQMKPRREYRAWYMLLTFSYQENEDLREEIGFGLSFRVAPVIEFPHWMTPLDVAKTRLVDEMKEDFEVHQVCSRMLKKCYIYSRHLEITDWLTHGKFCQKHAYHQVVITKKKEMEYLQTWLLYMEDQLGDFRYLPPPYNIYAHLGLVRYMGRSCLEQVWQDGTSVTFTAWSTGEPYNVFENQCTGMTVNVTSGKGSWLTCSCSSVPKPSRTRTFASVCERPYIISTGQGSVSNASGHQGIAYTEPEYKDMLFQCRSMEWIIYTAVCDGITDCSDGSDEIECSLLRYREVCAADDFSCGNGVCIHVGRVCDFVKDCPDGNDEFCSFPMCNAIEYSCANKQCVPIHARCDAIDDCYDGSDEYLCDTCNTTHAFSCGDLTCIPRSLVCDRIPHCDDRRDEESCAKTYRSCYEYWRDGYDQNVSLTDASSGLTAFSVECQIYWVNSFVLEIKSTLDFLLLWNAANYNREFAEIVASSFKDHGQKCTLQISEQCKYHLNEIASYIDPTYNGSYSFCRPRSVQIFSDGYSLWTHDNLDTIRSLTIQVKNHSASIQRISSVHIDFETSVFANISTTIGPVICTAEYLQTDINCGDGMTVSADRRCLYDFTKAGVIDGCRNFRHLDDCGKNRVPSRCNESTVCPHGFLKCPSSFCLAQRFVCDGKKQCPGGEDEENCWCVGGNCTLVFVYNDKLNEDIKSTIYKFARQFHSEGVKLYAVNYLDMSNRLTVTIREIHPYNEAFNLASEEGFISESELVEAELIKHFKNEPCITFINLELDLVSRQLATDIFINTSVDHVYHVRVDITMQGRANVTTTSKETNIVVKSLGILASIGSKLFPSLCRDTSLPRKAWDFKCGSSNIRIPLTQTCNGISQCPYNDDEAICDFKCVEKCSCKPYIANCQSSRIEENDLLELHSTIRILDISNNTVFEDGSLTIHKEFPYLLKLYAQRCELTSIKEMTFTNATSLIHLDLSFNKLKVLRKDAFFGLKHIIVLNLEDNALLSELEPSIFRMLNYLDNLSITKTRLSQIWPNTFSGLKLNTLDISENKINTIHAYAFKNLTALEINFEGNEIADFDPTLFVGVTDLQTIRSPAYKFCCYKPSTVQSDNCWPHEDEFSSCEDLMRNSILQTLLWMIGAAAVFANAATIIYRVIRNRKKVQKGFGMFVLNLAASDFLMGVYLIIIAIADISFRKRYMLEDDYWRNSIWCNIAGMLATVSSEASVLLMCLITVDRFLVIKYPFGQWRFSVRASRIAVATTWTISLTIALVPVLIQDYFQESFYSTSGVCLAMPLTHRRPPGWLYSFLIFVALNFVAFILIAIGQFFIYLEIRKSSKRMEQHISQRRNDIAIARNLLLVLTTDFLCWFPIGVMAIMAYDGHVISGDVYAWTAVLVVPVNSALNPFLYTLSAVVGSKKTLKTPSPPHETTKETTT